MYKVLQDPAACSLWDLISSRCPCHAREPSSEPLTVLFPLPFPQICTRPAPQPHQVFVRCHLSGAFLTILFKIATLTPSSSITTLALPVFSLFLCYTLHLTNLVYCLSHLIIMSVLQEKEFSSVLLHYPKCLEYYLDRLPVMLSMQEGSMSLQSVMGLHYGSPSLVNCVSRMPFLAASFLLSSLLLSYCNHLIRFFGFQFCPYSPSSTALFLEKPA